MAGSHRDGLPVPGRGCRCQCRRGRARAMPVIIGLGSQADIMMIDSRSQSPSLDSG